MSFNNDAEGIHKIDNGPESMMSSEKNTKMNKI